MDLTKEEGGKDNKSDPAKFAKYEIPKPDKAFRAFVGVNVKHAVYQEFGTKYADANPFLRPAVARVTKSRNVKREVERLTNQKMEDALTKGKVKIVTNIQNKTSLVEIK